MIRRRIQAIVALVAITALTAWSASGESGGAWQQSDNCSACHQKSGDETVSLFARSTHARSGITCNRCHGGDPFAREKQAAHGGRFIGKPSSNDTIAMCGSCHRAQLAAFKTSRHFPERRGVARVDCSGCHGAHLVGAQSLDFSFGYYCSGCHGLEYLPELPTDFQKMLAVADESRRLVRAIEEAGRKPSDEIVNRRKEIRRLIGGIVHPTNLEAEREKIAEIIKLGDELKKSVDADKQR